MQRHLRRRYDKESVIDHEICFNSLEKYPSIRFKLVLNRKLAEFESVWRKVLLLPVGVDVNTQRLILRQNCALGSFVLTTVLLCAQIMVLPVWWRHTEHMDTRLLKLTRYCPQTLLLTVSRR